jgi:hypothetical protein
MCRSLISDLLTRLKKRQQTPCLKSQDLLFKLIIIKAKSWFSPNP